MPSDLKFISFVRWFFYTALLAIAMHAVNVLGRMEVSIDSLNQRVAVVIEKTQWLDREQQSQGVRIQQLESKE